MPAPMPLEVPVTIATLPFSLFMLFLRFIVCLPMFRNQPLPHSFDCSRRFRWRFSPHITWLDNDKVDSERLQLSAIHISKRFERRLASTRRTANELAISKLMSLSKVVLRIHGLCCSWARSARGAAVRVRPVAGLITSRVPAPWTSFPCDQQ